MREEELKIIQELMDRLKDQMEYSEDDLGSRLGREKPDMAIMKIESEGDPMAMGDDEMPMDEMDADLDAPDMMLKKRLMKMRGA